ncbi:uncharacterized protein [Periplaneta americana]
MMDGIKLEPDADLSAVSNTDDVDLEKKTNLSMNMDEMNFQHDNSACDPTSLVNSEEPPDDRLFPILKFEPEEELCNMDTVQDELVLEPMSCGDERTERKMACNPYAVAQILMNEVMQKYQVDNTAPTYIDRRIAQELYSLLEQHVNGGAVVLEGQTLWRDSDETSDTLSEDSDTPDTRAHTSNSSNSYVPSPPTVTWKSIHEQFSEHTMQSVYDNVKIAKKTIAATARKFKIPPEKVRQIVTALEKGGTKEHKTARIRQHMYNQFQVARNMGLLIHYCHLKKWAKEAATAMDIPSFKASKCFLEKFKRRYKISSRKMTRIVARRDVTLDTSVRTRALEFVREVTDYITANAINADMVFSTDKSKFEYELASNKTLSVTGEKTNEAVVQSIASTTHSFTIQVLFSMSGHLAKKLYICLQEAGGKFGKCISETLQHNKPSNIEFDCNSSGKMSKAIVLSWMRKVLEPELTGSSLLLLNSCSGQINKNLPAKAFSDMDVNFHIKIIPRKATKYCQPLDVYFFQQYKLFARRMEEHIRCDDEHAVNLHDRIFIFKLHSFIYNQLSAPQYQPMLRYAWKASGYLSQDMLLPFRNVFDINFAVHGMCNASDCDSSAIITCSWCEMQLCLQHCLLTPHYHDME